MGGIRTRAVTGVVICGLKPKRSECSTARILHINHCIVPNTFRFTPLLSLITVSGNGMVDRGRIIISSKVVYMVSQRALGVGSLTTSRCYLPQQLSIEAIESADQVLSAVVEHVPEFSNFRFRVPGDTFSSIEWNICQSDSGNTGRDKS